MKPIKFNHNLKLPREALRDYHTKPNDMKEALEDMIFHFGYRGVVDNQPVIMTGGLSALESAFSALGWDDPHIIQEEGNTCDIKGCMEECTLGQRWGRYYLRLCHKHGSMAFKKKRRPPVKEYAIERESHRDKITGYLTHKTQ